MADFEDSGSLGSLTGTVSSEKALTLTQTGVLELADNWFSNVDASACRSSNTRRTEVPNNEGTAVQALLLAHQA